MLTEDEVGMVTDKVLSDIVSYFNILSSLQERIRCKVVDELVEDVVKYALSSEDILDPAGVRRIRRKVLGLQP